MKDHNTPTLLPIDRRFLEYFLTIIEDLPPEEHFALLRALRADPNTSSEPRYDFLVDMPEIIQVVRVVG